MTAKQSTQPDNSADCLKQAGAAFIGGTYAAHVARILVTSCSATHPSELCSRIFTQHIQIIAAKILIGGVLVPTGSIAPTWYVRRDRVTSF